MRLAILVVLIFAVVGTVHARRWGPDDFPDPKRDVNLCGRGGKPSNICDPDGILTIKQADRVEGIIKDIWEGVDPYVKAECGDAGRQGYQVAVALLRQMAVPPGTPPGDAAHQMAKALHARWGVGSAACDNGVVLLLAVDDRQVYISTGLGAQKSFSNNAASNVIGDMRPALRSMKYGKAVEQAVVDIGLGLAGRSSSGGWDWFPILFFGVIGFFVVSNFMSSRRERQAYKRCQDTLQSIKDEQDKLRTKQWSKPKTCPVCLEAFSVDPETGDDEIIQPSAPRTDLPGASSLDDTRSDESAPLLASESGGDVRASAYGDGIASSSASGSNGGVKPDGLRRRNSGGGRMGVARDAATPATEAESQAAAHKLPVTLRCGHTFCEPCLKEWFDRAATCPICRKNVNDGSEESKPGPGSSSAQRAERDGLGLRMDDTLLNQELAFRLGRMNALYPQFVTRGMVDTWTDQARRNGTFNWADTRDFALNDPAVRAHQEMRGSGGNSASFGGGIGGGGGAGGSW